MIDLHNRLQYPHSSWLLYKNPIQVRNSMTEVSGIVYMTSVHGLLNSFCVQNLLFKDEIWSRHSFLDV